MQREEEKQWSSLFRGRLSGLDWGPCHHLDFCERKHRQAAITGVGSWPRAGRHLANSSRVSKRLEACHIVLAGTLGLGLDLWVLKDRDKEGLPSHSPEELGTDTVPR